MSHPTPATAAEPAPAPRPGTLDARTLAARLAADGDDDAQRLVLVDVREDHEYLAGHLAGALHVPLSQIESDPAALLARLGPRPAVVYCRAGVRSLRAITVLAAAGARAPMFNLTGGILAWQAAGQALAAEV